MSTAIRSGELVELGRPKTTTGPAWISPNAAYPIGALAPGSWSMMGRPDTVPAVE
jgi:hypothetical protein